MSGKWEVQECHSDEYVENISGFNLVYLLSVWKIWSTALDFWLCVNWL